MAALTELLVDAVAREVVEHVPAGMHEEKNQILAKTITVLHTYSLASIYTSYCIYTNIP